MRINIFEAGLVTYLMAGKGFLPQDELMPERRTGKDGQNEVQCNTVPPVPPRKAPGNTHPC